MKSTYSQKAVTMIIGILVAVIVLFNLWLRSVDTDAAQIPKELLLKSPVNAVIPPLEKVVQATIKAMI
jgi:hypothetical protein